ncbi:MAG: ATP-grasp domain-containing protein [Ignisphaera sp.]
MASILLSEYVVSSYGCVSRYKSLLGEAYSMVSAIAKALQRSGVNIVITVSKYLSNCFKGSVAVVEGDYIEFVSKLSVHFDNVIVIAPPVELVKTVERIGNKFLGPSYDVVKRLSHKYETILTLDKCGVKVPYTRILCRGDDVKQVLKDFTMPLIVKPVVLAGSECVFIARGVDDAIKYSQIAFECDPTGCIVLQEYVDGVHGSISAVFNNDRVELYSLNLQLILLKGNKLEYRGGILPIRNTVYRGLAEGVLKKLSNCINGLRGYIGLDVVWNDSGMYVVEANPRFTTSTIGIAEIYEDFGSVLLGFKKVGGVYLGDITNGYIYIAKNDKSKSSQICPDISEETPMLTVRRYNTLKDAIGETDYKIIEKLAYRVDKDLF